MQFTKKKINEILKKHKEAFDDLAHYDLTREKRWGRVRIDITIDKKLLRSLEEMRKKTGKPISRIIEDSLRGSEQ